MAIVLYAGLVDLSSMIRRSLLNVQLRSPVVHGQKRKQVGIHLTIKYFGSWLGKCTRKLLVWLCLLYVTNKQEQSHPPSRHGYASHEL